MCDFIIIVTIHVHTHTQLILLRSTSSHWTLFGLPCLDKHTRTISITTTQLFVNRDGYLGCWDRVHWKVQLSWIITSCEFPFLGSTWHHLNPNSSPHVSSHNFLGHSMYLLYPDHFLPLGKDDLYNSTLARGNINTHTNRHPTPTFSPNVQPST